MFQQICLRIYKEPTHLYIYKNKIVLISSRLSIYSDDMTKKYE